jgi:hypothetical protein
MAMYSIFAERFRGQKQRKLRVHERLLIAFAVGGVMTSPSVIYALIGIPLLLVLVISGVPQISSESFHAMTAFTAAGLLAIFTGWYTNRVLFYRRTTGIVYLEHAALIVGGILWSVMLVVFGFSDTLP